MAFADLTASLKLDIQDFSDKLKSASDKMSRFAADTTTNYSGATAALRSHNLGLKDTARIVQGILVSQTFYTAANAIVDATRSLWDFNVALDYMHVTYSALFGDTKVASDFMSVLQEHSVETIFDYQNLADASKKLLAYGIEYENLMFIMEGLTNLGAMSGDSAALDRISLALGQIYTKGKLGAEEMRQLANAYIPITEILQDKFGLTGDDLKRVGDLNLPASDVINAIVDYANENFGSVGDAAMYTITGLQNRIVDTLKVVGAQMLTPITTAYKSFLVYISNGLDTLRSEFEAGGIGGVFEYLVPNEQTRQTIRQFIANVQNLFMTLVSVGVVAGQTFGNFMSVFATAFNIVAPLITTVVNALAALLNGMLQSRTGAMLLRVAVVAAAGAFVILRAQAAAALVITAVTNAVMGLSKALVLLASLITTHPILSLLAGLVVTLIGVSTASSSANKAISGLFDTISGANGTSSDDVLQSVEQDLLDSTNAADQFSNRLDEATDSANDLTDAIGKSGGAADKAKKKLGGLLSFDEVFKLPEKNSDSGSAGGGLGDGLIGALEGLAGGFGGLGDSLIPDIPDFTEFIKGFMDRLFGGLEQGVKDKLAATGLGAIIGGGIGAIIGGLLGGVPGAKIGAAIGTFVGGLVGLLWSTFDGAINNTVSGALAGIGAAISRAFMGAFGTTALSTINTSSLKGFFGSIGSLFKVTGLKELLKGGLIGAAIGVVVDGIAHLLWGTLEDKFENADADTAKVGQTIGGAIGTVIGGILGGPPGAIIGSAIGTFAGGLAGLFWEPIATYFNPKTNKLTGFFAKLGKDINKWAKDSLKDLKSWIKNTAKGFTGWIKDTGKGLGSWIKDTYDSFTGWVSDTFEGLSGWLSDTVAIFSDWDSINSETLGAWWNDTKEGFIEWFNDTIDGFTEWFNDTFEGLVQWVVDTVSSFTGWYNDTYETFSTWKTDLEDIINTFIADSIEAVVQWVEDLVEEYNNFKDECIEVLTGFGIAAYEAIAAAMKDMYDECVAKLEDIEESWDTTWGEIETALSEWWSDLNESVKTWFTSTKTAIKTKLNEIKKEWSDKFDAIETVIKTWFEDLPTSIKTWFADTKTAFTTKLNEVKKSWSDKFDTIADNVETWFDDLPGDIKTWFSDTKTAISTKLSEVTSQWSTAFSTIWTNLKKWFEDLYEDMETWLDDNIWDPVSDFFTISNFWTPLKSKLDDIKSKVSSWWDGVKSKFSETISFNATATTSTTGAAGTLNGHASGGVFNREHIARFAEGNKAEAIIPLENNSAMQPFVDAVAGGLNSYLAPLVASASGSNSNMLPPMYVGTLIADDRGIKELYKRFEIIQLQEAARRGET